MTSAGSDAAMPTPMTPADANAPTAITEGTVPSTEKLPRHRRKCRGDSEARRGGDGGNAADQYARADTYSDRKGLVGVPQCRLHVSRRVVGERRIGVGNAQRRSLGVLDRVLGLFHRQRGAVGRELLFRWRARRTASTTPPTLHCGPGSYCSKPNPAGTV